MDKSLRTDAAAIFQFLAWILLIFCGASLLALGLKVLGLAVFGFMAPLIFSFSPLIACKLVTRQSVREMAAAIFRKRQSFWLPLLVFTACLLLQVWLIPDKAPLSERLPQLPVLLLGGLLAGLSEESGWRGFLQPSLEKGLSLIPSSLLTAVIWSSWHIPLWLLGGVPISAGRIFFQLVQGIFFSIAFAGLYKQSRSILACILLHALVNLILPLFLTRMTETWADFLPLLPGFLAMAAYGSYLWYRASADTP